MANRHPKIIAEFMDEFEEKRVIHKTRHGTLRMKRFRETVGQSLSKAVGDIAGRNIKRVRKERGLSLVELARRAGLTPTKQRMKEIEDNNSGGLRIGTVYACAGALGVSIVEILPPVSEAFKAAEVSQQRITEPTIAFTREIA